MGMKPSRSATSVASYIHMLHTYTLRHTHINIY